ncbi:MAG TPA: hypothetical protein PL048_09395 [Leptospiraceae bacterium]|nr:hypothetical protein [Leptospiraceae bacterium]HMY68780.1 hypothetical protein [Leptospiraceae bacterium]HMZ58977.1 hypothetical protein [Leptospiraceae bacterium]HNF12372.1 hypothetical protein [Leptospiraceae bacterium]HNF26679.1 hypothetical protein [Leptospiraceae bacterium]
MYKNAVIIIMFLILGCTSRMGDFTVVSTRNSNIKNWKRHSERVEGSSCKWYLFFIKVKDWDLKDAIEDAVDKTNRSSSSKNESLLDVKLSTNWFHLILFGRSCIVAEGTPADSWYVTEEREEQIKK